MRRYLLLIILLLPLFAAGQPVRHSWDGCGLSPTTKMRTLNIFANIIFDVNPSKDPVWNSPYWHKITDPAKAGVNVPGTEPSYLLDYMDTVYVPGHTHGSITRVFGESSFDSMQIVGDFVVVNLLESRMYSRFGQGNVFSLDKILTLCLEMIEETGGLSTLYGHNRRSDYTYNGKDLYYTLLYVRNTSRALGGINTGSGYGNFYSKYILIDNEQVMFSGKGAMQCVGSSNFGINPTGVATHEIAHSLFGTNDFHTSGGNNRAGACTMCFMNIQGGYGLMGAANTGLVCCNGYERWRMHWKHPSSPYYICARNRENTDFLNADISKDDGSQTFVLRDFVTYGDAIRIRLPYKDSSITPNQYIWLEFHDVGHNNKLDFIQHSNEKECLQKGSSGIYAYYQIGRDILEGTASQVWDRVNRDNLRVISNEGYWDYVQSPLPKDTDFVCTQWGAVGYYYTPKYSNAFCGYQDQELFIVPKEQDTDLSNTIDNVFDNGKLVRKEATIREVTPHNMIKSGTMVTHSISYIGDNQDAFSSHRKINMGTNPSTCNTKTCYTNSTGKTKLSFQQNSDKNNKTTYLTGLSIEMTPLNNGRLWQVDIRWDDYDITDEARWTGQIVLKGNEQVNLTQGHSITLAQNRTPAQSHRNPESGYFADPTMLVCEDGSIFIQQPRTSLQITEKSLFVMDSGAVYRLGEKAKIVLQGGSSFYIDPGADFQGTASSEIIVKKSSTLYVRDVAKLQEKMRITVRSGGKIVNI